jgi:hypothetical protein
MAMNMKMRVSQKNVFSNGPNQVGTSIQAVSTTSDGKEMQETVRGASLNFTIVGETESNEYAFNDLLAITVSKDGSVTVQKLPTSE